MFPEAVALFSVDHEAEYQKFKEQEDGVMAGKIYYLLTDCKCPIYFRNNAEVYESAKWLASNGVRVAAPQESQKEATP